jgi:hypothetical protein
MRGINLNRLALDFRELALTTSAHLAIPKGALKDHSSPDAFPGNRAPADVPWETAWIDLGGEG